MKPFRIISFDGGGIRGALSTRILRKLVEKNRTLIYDTNLFAGTSTGAIIALCLAFGLSAKRADTLYSYENLKKIFGRKRLNLFHPKYNNANLIDIFNQAIPNNTKLKDLRKYVYVPAFNVLNFKDEFFNNLPNSTNSETKVLDVALSSSAAPTYFPSNNNYIDGGVVSNSPSIASVISVIHNFSPYYDISDFRVLSIGTGDNPKSIPYDTRNWGVLKWAFNPFSKVKSPIASVLLDDTSSLADKYCKELLGNNYFRINPVLGNQIELDDYKKVNYLIDIADKYNLDSADSFIKKHFLSSYMKRKLPKYQL